MRARIARFPETTDVNPYQRLLYAHLRAEGVELAPDGPFRVWRLWRARPRVTHIHFHWQPERCWLGRRMPARLGAAVFLARVRIARALGLRIAWTVHELYRAPRLDPRLERRVARRLARLCDTLFVHDRALAGRVAAELDLPPAALTVVDHPAFARHYPAGRPREEVRAALGIDRDAVVLLHLGIARPNKEVGLLLDAFDRVPGRSVRLVVAGEARDPELAWRLRAALAGDRRIHASLCQVPEAGVAELFQASDVFVHPGGDGWTSGSLLLALSMGLPVVCADSEVNRAAIGGDLAGWCFAPHDVVGLARALEVASGDPAGIAARGAAAAGLAAARPDWTALARATAAELLPAPAGAVVAAGEPPAVAAVALSAAPR